MPLTLNRSNVLLDGISEWRIKDVTRPDDAYYALPYPREGKFSLDALGKPDSKGRPTSFGAYKLEGSVMTPALRTSANLIKLLDSLGTQKIDHKITMNSGQIFSSGLATETGLGIKWKVVSDADMDDDMHIILEAGRILTQTEYNACLVSASAPVNGTPNVLDTFYAMNSLTRTDIVPAGISKIELGVGGYPDDIGVIKQGKYTAELMTELDSRQRFAGFGIKIDVEAIALQSVEAELLQWDGIAQQVNDVKVTFVNGLVCTMATTLGVLFKFTIEKDADGASFVKFTGSGKIAKSSWDGLWSA